MNTTTFRFWAPVRRLLSLRIAIGFMLPALFMSVVVPFAAARDVLIRVVGDGAGAQYVLDGADPPGSPVSVSVGDVVVWANDSNRIHTATAEGPGGSLLFDTGEIARQARSAEVEITQDLFNQAGGQPGQAVTVPYFCDIHPSMRSALIISLADRPPTGPGQMRVRRDITTLSPAELNRYRDAWRRLQQSGEFHELAGHHGCPDWWCHRPGEERTFLAWHREYLLRLELALGEPLHYWNWNAPVAAETGIPALFSEPTYVSPEDGSTRPNPLMSFRYRCPAGSPAMTTSRNPRPPFMLGQIAAEVPNAYLSSDYASLNASLEHPPHNSVHGWIGGTMAAVNAAAYDPIFWAHHSNVDRQWASWQLGGGADPVASDRNLPLTGFTGRTVGDVISIAALGYDYDRFDTMPAGQGRAPMAANNRARTGQGVGKTFRIAAAGMESANAVSDAKVPLDLYVSGLPEHPAESYFVYVFVNQPDAGPNDATADNPNFAGSFGIFGTGDGANAGPAHNLDADNMRRAMRMFAGSESRVAGGIRAVTLVVTDPTGAVVSREDIPFNAVDLRSPNAVPAQESAAVAASTFVGVSDNESWDEAYRDAVNRAESSLLEGRGADRMIGVRVLSVEGDRGGIAGLKRLTVRIEAWLK